MKLSLRPKTKSDLRFLFEVYTSSRADEMAMTSWPDHQREDFLSRQFKAQSNSYESEYPRSICSVVSVDGENCGRLWVDHQPDEVRILDFSLLPKFCGQGIGTKLLEELSEEARQAEKPLTVYVHKHNQRGQNFYLRFGFRPGIESQFAVLYTWSAPRIVV